MFHQGQRVRVKKFRREGVVVEGPSKGGKYLVTVNSLNVWLAEEDLDAVLGDAIQTKKKKVQVLAKKRTPPKHVDLHGMTVEQAKQKVLEYINEAILAGLNDVEIIHGIGSGKVREAVHQILTKSKVVKQFVVAPGNPGTTIAYL